MSDLLHRLKLQFNIKLFADLGEVCTSPGSALKLLKSVYQSEYNHNDRLVFYTSQDIPESLIEHLYETCNFLDISNCFVLICSPNKQNCLRIEEGCKKYSTDPIPFRVLLTDNIKNTTPLSLNFALPKSICPIPWNNLQIRNNGDITPCCMTSGITYGNISTVSLKDAFISKTAKNFRNRLLNGERPDNCKSCWTVEDQGLTSIRLHNKKRLYEKFLLENLKSPEINNLDITFNNTCNFKCRICNGYSSSLYAQEEHKFFGVPLRIQKKWSETDDFATKVAEITSSINNIDMYGGEPFLIKKFSDVLETMVVSNYSKNIRLHYNSNGSVWPGEFISYWPEFKEVDIHFSIDNIGRRFELERGGSWQEVEQNILKIKNLNFPNLTINIMPTISIMNVYYIDDVYTWATKHGFQLFVSHVRGNGFDLSNLTKEAKNLIIEKYKNHPWGEMQQLLKTISLQKDSNGEAFRQRIRKYDTIRKENFAKTHPEIASAMGYVYNSQT